MNRNYALIGAGVVNKVFEKNEDPLDKLITVGNGRYKVIGVLEESGSSMGGDSDNLCILPYTNVRQYFSRPNMRYSINVTPLDATLMEPAMGEAEGVFTIERRTSDGELTMRLQGAVKERDSIRWEPAGG